MSIGLQAAIAQIGMFVTVEQEWPTLQIVEEVELALGLGSLRCRRRVSSTGVGQVLQRGKVCFQPFAILK